MFAHGMRSYQLQVIVVRFRFRLHSLQVTTEVCQILDLLDQYVSLDFVRV